MTPYVQYTSFPACRAVAWPEPVIKVILDMTATAGEYIRVMDLRRLNSDAGAADLDDINLSRHGDSEAYRRLVERHQQHVGRIMWRFSRDITVHEELVQDVFVEAYMGLSGYRASAPFAHWLARIATRIGYRYWRQAKRKHRTEPFSIEQWDQATGETSGDNDPQIAAEMLHKLLAGLPARDRLVLTLRYLDDLDVAQIADRTGWSRAMVKVQCWRARNRLRGLFEKAQKGAIL